MRWWGLFILLSFNFFSVPSLALQESEQPFVYDLLEEGEFYQVGTFKGQGDIPLYYAKFGRGQGEKGSLVFINGLAENLFKYLELFYDLYLQGYSPIYTYDHRGQGLSNRFLSDPKAGYVEYFSHYSKDLRIFLHNVVPKDSEVDQDNLFAIAHSMGGTVLVDYLQTPSPDVKRRISRSGVVMLGNPEYPKEFKAIVLSSPLFYPQHDDSEYPDWVVLNVFRFQKCASSFFSFDSCLKYDLITSSRSKLTNSRARYKFFSRTREFVQEAFDMPDPWVIPTYDWIIKMTGLSKCLKPPFQTSPKNSRAKTSLSQI